MRIGFAIGGIPSLGQSGSTLASWTIIEELLRAGHDVTAILLPAAELIDETAPERFAALERLGAVVRAIEHPPPPPPPTPGGRWRVRGSFLRSLVRPRDDQLFPSLRAGEAVRGSLAEAEVEAGMAFGIEAIAATAPSAASPPLAALLSHPPGVSRRVRLRYTAGPQRGLRPEALLSLASELSFLAYANRRTAGLLRGFPLVEVFSARHAAWARNRGARARYAHYPMPDLAGPSWRDRRSSIGRGDRPRILMIGHLRGIGTISGLHLFVPSILPRLSDALGPDGFEVSVVGGQEPPPEFAAGLDHPAVHLRGQLEDPAEEFLGADVLLAPNPTTTGASARILSGLSFGSCIVAHTDSLVGIPELVHEENCLLGGDGPTLAAETLRALGDAQLRKGLGENARALYEGAFSPNVAARRLVRDLERLAAP